MFIKDDTVNDLLEEAQTQPESIRATETANIKNFDVPKQSFTDEIKSANKEVALIQTSNSLFAAVASPCGSSTWMNNNNSFLA